MAEPSRNQAPALAGSAALVLAGAVLSFWRLDVPSWNPDEYLYAIVGDHYWRGDFGANPEHPPLWKEVIGASRVAFGHTLWAARFPAAVVMLLTGLLLWWWLRRVAPAGAGPVAAVLWWTLPAPTSYPETDAAGVWGLRYGLLDVPAGAFGFAAVIAGWWWARSGRLPAAAACGALAGLAVATKLPAVLVVVVPAVAGVVAALTRPGSWPARAGRAVGHGTVWAVTAAAVFVAPYLPMGWYAVNRFEAGWRYQRQHGIDGHVTLVDGLVTGRPPWWSFPWWQYATVGAAAAAVLAGCVLAAVAARPRLGGYLTAAWVVPMMLLLPAGRVGMPGYIQLWRPGLVASAAVGGAAAAGWVWQQRTTWRGPVAAAALTAAAVVAAAPAAAAVDRTRHLTPADYAALPELVPQGTVWLVGCRTCAVAYLPGRATLTLPRGTPAAVAIQRSVGVRTPSAAFRVDWSRDHGYRMVRTGSLEVWIRP